ASDLAAGPDDLVGAWQLELELHEACGARGVALEHAMQVHPRRRDVAGDAALEALVDVLIEEHLELDPVVVSLVRHVGYCSTEGGRTQTTLSSSADATAS